MCISPAYVHIAFWMLNTLPRIWKAIPWGSRVHMALLLLRVEPQILNWEGLDLAPAAFPPWTGRI